MIGAQVGNYIIEAELGVGGMGAVYRARHAVLGRMAAIKVLLPQFSATPDIVQRFFNEAKAATSIRHLGIVEVYDFGLMNNGVAFIVMEMLRGESLGSRMRGRRMTPQAYLSTVRQICGALGAAHDLGIVHRDLKPDNVFLVPDGEVETGERIKLLDFGIAKLSLESPGTANQTRTGSVMGTPAYMAPEQCRGVKVDHRADIYSLGCILFEMVTGRPPFRGEGFGDVLAAHIYAKHDPIETLAPNAPPGVARLIDRLLAKDPAERPQTTRELIAEIDDVGAALSSTVGATTPRRGIVAIEPPPFPLGSVAPAATTVPPAWSDAAPAKRPSPASRAGRRMLGIAAALAAAGIAIAIVATAGPGEVAPRTIEAAAVVASAPPAVPTVLDAGVAVAAPAPELVNVEIDSTPSNARVWLDGKDLGATPYRGTVPRSEATLQLLVRHAGFDDFRRDVHPSAQISELARLTPTRGTRVQTGPRAHAGAATGTPPASTVVAPPPHRVLTEDDTLPPSHGQGSAQ
jgi:serine/threonine-protein kinase